jgi:hypothetical protein
MNKGRELHRIVFLASIFLLLLNDLYLKYEYHNYLTGKLSDFAGLFSFPYFLSCFFPKKTKLIYYLTGIFFLIWKSEFSQPIFDFVHSYNIGVNRVVDYSDLIALIILPFSYYYKLDYSIKIEKLKFLPRPIVVGISAFAFIATSLPREGGTLNLKSDYEVQFDIPLDTLVKKINAYYQRYDDPYYEVVIEIPDKQSRVFVKTIITEVADGKTNLKLDSILYFETFSKGFWGVKKKNVNYMKSLKLEDFEELFIEQNSNIVLKE